MSWALEKSMNVANEIDLPLIAVKISWVSSETEIISETEIMVELVFLKPL